MGRYRIAETRKTVRHRNSGFEYQGKILDNTLSKLITEDEAHKGFLENLESVVTNLIDQVKRIKCWVNFTVDKNDRTIL